MENQITAAYSEKFGRVRIVFIKGKPYFVAIDVAKALLFKDTDKAVRERVDARDKLKFDPALNSDCSGVKIAKGAYLINESGLWSLVLNSKLPKAREFQHWLTSEVIPEIVRTGSYNPTNARTFQPITPDFSRREKVDILLKLLNIPNLPINLRNRIVNDIELLLSNFELQQMIND